MRRLFGLFALLVGVSLLVTTTSSAKDPEGRVVNTKMQRSVKKPVEPAPQRPSRWRPLRPTRNRWNRPRPKPARSRLHRHTEQITDEDCAGRGRDSHPNL